MASASKSGKAKAAEKEPLKEEKESKAKAAKPAAKAGEAKPAAAKAKKSDAPAESSTASASTSHYKTFVPYEQKKDEDYMSPGMKDHFRAILQKWKQELMEEVDRTVHHMQDESANLPDPADRATQEEEFSLELRARDRERKLIKNIEQALERIEKDDYGYCDACGIEIGLRRLEARPTAKLCIDCKTLQEIKEKQIGG